MQVTVVAVHIKVLKFIESHSSFYKGAKPTTYLNKNGTYFSVGLIYSHSKAAFSAQRSLSVYQCFLFSWIYQIYLSAKLLASWIKILNNIQKETNREAYINMQNNDAGKF